MSLSSSLLPDAHAVHHNKEPENLEKDKSNSTQHNTNWNEKDVFIDASQKAKGSKESKNNPNWNG